MSIPLRAYSLGYQGTDLDQYVQVLKSHQISVVIDVRETPWSYKPGFSKKPLADRLEAEQIAYVHLKSAGNPSKNRKGGFTQAEVIRLYEKHLDANPECLDEVFRLIAENGKSGAVCLLCFEEKPHECHRKVILDRLGDKNSNLMTCHLHASLSEETVVSPWIPKPDNRKRSRKHMEVAKNKCRIVVS